MEPVTLKYSEAFVKKAVRAYWWKTIGPIYPMVSVLLAGYVIYKAMNGDRSWLIGFFGSVVIIGVLVMVASYFVHLNRSLSRLKRMKIPEATLQLGEEKFKIVSDVGSSEMQWSLIKQIWCFEYAWLLLISGSEFMTLPTDGLSEQAKAFIVERAKVYGAKIV